MNEYIYSDDVIYTFSLAFPEQKNETFATPKQDPQCPQVFILLILNKCYSLVSNKCLELHGEIEKAGTKR